MTSRKNPNVLVCSDKYKDSITADEVNNTISNVLRQTYGDKVAISTLILSDGGDGFLKSLAHPLCLETVSAPVKGPLGDLVEAEYGINQERKLAVIEMATASGLELVPEDDRNPLVTTTYGTGELIVHAYNQGCRKVLLGIGGSATNDGGLGALQALGMVIHVNDLVLGQPAAGQHMSMVTKLEFHNKCPGLEIEIACDVTSPFTGPNGAVHVFSKQKGATPAIQDELEIGMDHLARLYLQQTGVDLVHVPGSGAAGGIGGALHAWLGAKLVKGIEMMGESVGLRDAVNKSDLVITGEGKFDLQTAAGKVVSYVQALCDEHGIPCVVVCGRNESGQTHNVYELVSRFPVEECMRNAASCLTNLLEENVGKFPVLDNLR